MGIRFCAQRKGDVLAVRTLLPTLVVLSNNGLAQVRTRDSSLAVDSATLLLLPSGLSARVAPKSPLTHVVLLTISAELAAHAVRTYAGELQAPTLSRYLAQLQLLPRPNWLNELCHRYLFERAACRKRDNEATRFLETEIVKELYFLALAREHAQERRSIVELDSPLVARALRAMEAGLFSRDVLGGLARACGASPSTLLRAFQRELGTSPLHYLRARRLDEARLLLKSGRFSVGEIAFKVGYASQAAFAEAFRARFGMPPSAVRAARRGGQSSLL